MVGKFVVLFLLCGYHFLRLAQADPQYRFVLESLIKEIEETSVMEAVVSFEELSNGTFITNGELNLLVDLDDDWKVGALLMFTSDDGNHYTLNLPKIGVCDMMKHFYKDYLYNSLRDYSNAPEPDECPVGKGTFVLSNYALDSTGLQYRMGPGDFSITVSLFTSADNTEKVKYIVKGSIEEVL